MKNNFIVVNFFRVTDPYSGGSEVSFNFFKNIPSKNKWLFQYSNKKKKYNNVESVFIKDTKIQKLFNINKLANKIKKICKNKKNLIIIIEGGSWAGYTYFLYKILKKDLKSAKFIYHSQNIEYVIRKYRENFLITFITRYFENFIAKNFDIFTCTSSHEKKTLKKLYKLNASILSNGLELPKNILKIKPIEKNFHYIFFCGSIDFFANYDALSVLVNDIMPIINKHNPNIKLIVSGNKSLPFKNKSLINIGFVSKKIFFKYLKGASLFVNPMQITFGVQTKTLHALALGKTIIATKQGVAGIKINPSFNNIHIANNNNFYKQILNNINKSKINKSASKYYSSIYSMKKIVNDFLHKKKLLV